MHPAELSACDNNLNVRMKDIYNISGKDVFDDSSIPIVVRNSEHHGSGKCHTHSFLEFVYIKRGFALHTYNEITTILTSGDLFAIRPGDIHGYTSANHTYLYNCLFFSEALGGMWEDIKELPGAKQVLGIDELPAWKRIHLDIQGRGQVEDYLEKIKWERQNKKPGWELKLRSLLTGFLVLFFRAYSEHYGTSDDYGYKYSGHVYKALGFIESNYSKNISVNEIASAVDLSPDYLSKQFKQFTGMTLIEYVKNFRFAKAIEILKDPAVSVAEVANRVGYEDPCYFTRQFKQLMKMSPSEYRKT